MSASNTKLGRVTRITNLFKKWNEAGIYICIWTEQNKEDWGKRGFLQTCLINSLLGA